MSIYTLMPSLKSLSHLATCFERVQSRSRYHALRRKWLRAPWASIQALTTATRKGPAIRVLGRAP